MNKAKKEETEVLTDLDSIIEGFVGTLHYDNVSEIKRDLNNLIHDLRTYEINTRPSEANETSVINLTGIKNHIRADLEHQKEYRPMPDKNKERIRSEGYIRSIMHIEEYEKDSESTTAPKNTGGTEEALREINDQIMYFNMYSDEYAPINVKGMLKQFHKIKSILGGE